MEPSPKPPVASRPLRRPFRAAVLRGLGGLLPPLLTVVLIVALYGMVRDYVLVPLENSANWILANWEAQSIVAPDLAAESPPERTQIGGESYRLASDGRYVPERVFATVRNEEGLLIAESYTAWRLCERYVDHVYLRGYLTIPALLSIFILAMYFLGKMLSGRLLPFAWRGVEHLIRKVPVLRNVYSAAQQVTAFVLARQTLRDGEVVAVEYPREQTWTVGYVTGDGLRDVAQAAGEPVISVLVDTSPVPFNGFTCMVPRRQVVKLSLTIDEALQYIISCGVIKPGGDAKAKEMGASPH